MRLKCLPEVYSFELRDLGLYTPMLVGHLMLVWLPLGRNESLVLSLALAIPTFPHGVPQGRPICQQAENRSGQCITMSPMQKMNLVLFAFILVLWVILCTSRLRTSSGDKSLIMKRKKGYVDIFLIGPAPYLPPREFPLVQQHWHQGTSALWGCFWPLQAEFITLFLEQSLILYKLPLLHICTPY